MTEIATPPSGAPAFPSDRTCPYRLPDEYNDLRTREGSLQRVTLYDGRQAWLVTGYDTARKLLADPRLSSDRRHVDFPATSGRVESFRDRRPAFIGLDPPEHGPKRRMTISEFTVRRIKGMRADVEQIVHGFLDRMIDSGPPADLVSQFSLPVPSMVICQLLGVPYADHDFFQDASQRLIQSPDVAGARTARDDLEGYLGGLADTLRGKPGPGLLSTLVTEQWEKGTIDRDELVSTAILLLVMRPRDHSVDDIAERRHPARTPRAVRRTARRPVAGAGRGGGTAAPSGDRRHRRGRFATADIEIDGRCIRAGEGVIVTNSIANRDSSVFADPDVFDVRREARHHLSFGYGVHQCLGQNLARLELEVVLTALLERLPDLRLAVPVDRLDLRPGTTIQGVNELPVTW